MKQPANWSNGASKNPTNWQGANKNATAWGATNTPRLADQWSSTAPKVPSNWDSGQWLYDSFLPYDTPVSYDGFPKPINTKAPSAWIKI
jgi:hypothetical protein